jgi:hypothetical protein
MVRLDIVSTSRSFENIFIIDWASFSPNLCFKGCQRYIGNYWHLRIGAVPMGIQLFTYFNISNSNIRFALTNDSYPNSHWFEFVISRSAGPFFL